MTASAPAKVNLVLDVLGRRSDGFHNIHSLAIAISLCDTLSATVPNLAGLSLECSDPSLSDSQNLAMRAARALSDFGGIRPEAMMNLEKNIPVGAGLGGGSSDAAAALRVCNELWSIGAADHVLARIGAAIGSDIPLFFTLPVAEVSGRGEFVQSASLTWKGYVLVVYPGIHVRTADVYQAWQPADAAPKERVDFDKLTALRSAAEWNAVLRNDLEPAVFRVCPAVLSAKEAVESLGLSPFRVTGSGSAFFCLYDCQDRALYDATTIRSAHSNMQVAVADGPVNSFPLEYKES